MNEHNPVSNVQWIPMEKVCANDYNPNHVAVMEMKLLYITPLQCDETLQGHLQEESGTVAGGSYR